MKPVVRVVVLSGAEAPTYATPGSAGLDLRSVEDIELRPMERTLARTGLVLSIPAGYEGQIRARSGLAHKHGIALVNSPGTIDSDYRGEVGVLLINLGSDVVKLARGDRIAQLVVSPVSQAEVQVVDEIDSTVRGIGGFGSTGTR